MNDFDRIKKLTLEWTRAQPTVARFIRSFVRNRADAEDLLQEVALTIVDRFEKYDPAHPFPAWAIGIARNTLKAHFRKQLRQLPGVKDESVIDQVADAFEKLQPELEDMKEVLTGCIQKVPTSERKMLALHYEEGLKPAAIAQKMGLSANHIAVQLYRLRKGLRRCVEQKMITLKPAT
jgi:RNA polymerase sigma-70 factor (ECF subfamily)